MTVINIGESCSSNVKFVFEDRECPCGVPAIAHNLFKGEYLSSFPVLGEDSVILYIGLGKAKELDCIRIKSAAAKAQKQMRKWNIMQFSIDICELVESAGIKAVWDIAEGIQLGAYQLKPDEDIFKISLSGVPDALKAKALRLLEKAESVSKSILFARNLVNAPANHMTPADMAEAIKDFCASPQIEVEIIEQDKAEQLGMGAFLTVGKSSSHPLKLIVLRYKGAPSHAETTALIGKGITCDTGGYCLKPASSMGGIKGDMAGAAAVAGTVSALAANKVKANVVAVIPACENRISPDSFIPGDVITSMSGKTIEIKNTDAEGRLILADAVTYAIEKENAARILDIATLTGAVVNTFGFTVAGAMTSDDSFWKEFEQGYALSGEKYWLLPSYPEYRALLKSDLADIKNIGAKHSGTITAGMFIKEFTQGKPWIHLDIAGTAWVDTPEYEFQSKGATGCAVSSLYRMFDKETMD